jgi:Icc-related predicted phosphoesterase
MALKIEAYSDIHLEHYRGNAWRAVIEGLNPKGVDVVILAGDISSNANLRLALGAFCGRYPHVLYVTGNHEYYGASKASIDEVIKDVAAEHPNLHWLNRSSVTIEGQRFLGATLWFREAPLAPMQMMNDIHLITDFTSWVYEENRKDIDFLRDNVQEGDIVVTHYLPSNLSVAPEYAGSPLNAFFVCNVEDIIHDKKPALWVHGHTHGSLDYVVGQTRVVCNPKGYPIERNSRFKAQNSV